jgi:hypothetical protein
MKWLFPSILLIFIFSQGAESGDTKMLQFSSDCNQLKEDSLYRACKDAFDNGTSFSYKVDSTGGIKKEEKEAIKPEEKDEQKQTLHGILVATTVTAVCSVIGLGISIAVFIFAIANS